MTSLARLSPEDCLYAVIQRSLGDEGSSKTHLSMVTRLSVNHRYLLFFLDSSQDIHHALNDGGVRPTVVKILPLVIQSEAKNSGKNGK